ncbi:hypothetical protein L0152_07280 [bacterium]|nr:hypothetical protein [bacterium]
MSILDEILPKKFESRERFRKSEVAEILGCSESTINNLEDAGDLNPISTTDAIKWYTRGDLEAYLALRQLLYLQKRQSLSPKTSNSRKSLKLG